MKRFLSVVLALILVFSLSVSSFAYAITLRGTAAYTGYSNKSLSDTAISGYGLYSESDGKRILGKFITSNLPDSDKTFLIDWFSSYNSGSPYTSCFFTPSDGKVYFLKFSNPSSVDLKYAYTFHYTRVDASSSVKYDDYYVMFNYPVNYVSFSPSVSGFSVSEHLSRFSSVNGDMYRFPSMYASFLCYPTGAPFYQYNHELIDYGGDIFAYLRLSSSNAILKDVVFTDDSGLDGFYNPVVSCRLTVNYQYADGSKAAEPYSGLFLKDSSYSVASPSIAGYLPDKTTVSGTMGEQDVTVTVTYSPVIPKHSLTIDYIYTGGEKAVDSIVQTFDEGSPYSVASPSIVGYLPDKATISGTMGEQDVSVTVTYSPVIPKHSLTIDYIYTGGGKAVDSVVQTFDEGSSYSVASPSIAGYRADRTTVSGTMGEQDISVMVTYMPVTPELSEHTLTIHYIFEGGETASSSYSQIYLSGAPYSVKSPLLSGYASDKSVVSGFMPDNDFVVSVTYVQNSSSGGGGIGGGSYPWGDWNFSNPFQRPSGGSAPNFSNPFQKPSGGSAPNFSNPFQKPSGGSAPNFSNPFVKPDNLSSYNFSNPFVNPY